MTVALGLVLFGFLFVYAGIKGKSVSSLLLGDNQTSSQKPASVSRGGDVPVSTSIPTYNPTPGNPVAPSGKQTGTGILGLAGKIIGLPFQGTHSKATNVAGGSDNWQSENAVDISVPVGTPVYAPESGSVVRAGALPGNPGGRFAGLRVTLQGNGNAFYFAHLSKVLVSVGQSIQPGQLLGYTGSANGVAHLHFATQNGSPLNWIVKHI